MNPYHTLALVFGYLMTIFVLTQIMKRVSKPFPTKYLALWHNLFCTVLSLYMCIEIWRQAWIGRYNLISQSIDRTEKGLPVSRNTTQTNENLNWGKSRRMRTRTLMIDTLLHSLFLLSSDGLCPLGVLCL